MGVGWGGVVCVAGGEGARKERVWYGVCGEKRRGREHDLSTKMDLFFLDETL